MSAQAFFELFERKVYIRLTDDETGFVCTIQRGILHRKPVIFPVKEACTAPVWGNDLPAMAAPILPGDSGKVQFRGDCDGGDQTAIDGAPVGEDAVHALGGGSVLFIRPQPQLHMNPLDHEHTFFFFDFTHGVGHEPVD